MKQETKAKSYGVEKSTFWYSILFTQLTLINTEKYFIFLCAIPEWKFVLISDNNNNNKKLEMRTHGRISKDSVCEIGSYICNLSPSSIALIYLCL